MLFRNIFCFREDGSGHKVNYELMNIDMKRELFSFSGLLSVCCIMISGCLKKEGETIALPSIGTATDVIPLEIRQEFDTHMDIYEGTTPPDISGTYLMAPNKLYYASDSDKAPSSFADSYFAFFNKQGNTYEYKSKQSSSTGHSPLVTVIGSGDTFTAYFTERSQKDDGVTWSVMATLLSGRVTTRGIEDIKYAFIMLDVNDPYDQIMEVNEYRVFYDGDGVAASTYWDYTKASPASTDSACESIVSAVKPE